MCVENSGCVTLLLCVSHDQELAHLRRVLAFECEVFDSGETNASKRDVYGEAEGAKTATVASVIHKKSTTSLSQLSGGVGSSYMEFDSKAR